MTQRKYTGYVMTQITAEEENLSDTEIRALMSPLVDQHIPPNAEKSALVITRVAHCISRHWERYEEDK